MLASKTKQTDTVYRSDPQSTIKQSGSFEVPMKNASNKNQNVQVIDDSSKVVFFILKNVEDNIILAIRLVWKKLYRTLNKFMCFAIKSYSAITQFFSWFLFWPLFNILFKIKISGRQNLVGLKSPLIMISNHVRFYDSFLFRLAVGPFSRLLPMRFMGVNRFIDPFMNTMAKIGVVTFIYSLFGVFVIEQGMGLQKNLHRAKGILRNKGIVAMFPEGRINRTGEIAMFKRGVSALALNMRVKVLPMGIKIEGRKININIGKAEYLETSKTYEELAEDLREKVRRLVA
jgi:1-acyl-sn-glycerol-3-phosphate acyltransferase